MRMTIVCMLNDDFGSAAFWGVLVEGSDGLALLKHVVVWRKVAVTVVWDPDLVLAHELAVGQVGVVVLA